MGVMLNHGEPITAPLTVESVSQSHQRLLTGFTPYDFENIRSAP